MITVYINERPLQITRSEEALPTAEDTITRTIAALENGETGQAELSGPNPTALFDRVSRHFTLFTAAGGLITNPTGEILLMFRRGKWDLPKGKLDDGETLEECALREVSEETGLHSITLGEKITETYHYYPWKGKKILKASHWYRMHFTGNELTVPQIEEDILDIQWIRPENLGKYMQYSYRNIMDVMEKAGYVI